MSIIKILQENKEYKFVCEGNFWCHKNNLKTLENVPNYVGRNFWCHNNNLVSLDGAPKHVDGNFYCSFNNLISLQGAPKHVAGSFACRGNPDLSREEIIKYHKTGAVKDTIYSDHGTFK